MGTWSTVSFVWSVAQLYKSVELGIDMCWSYRVGRHYARTALRRLAWGPLNVDALDKKWKRRQPLWQALSSKRLRAIGDWFRAPVFIIGQAMLLLCAPEHPSAWRDAALLTALIATLCGVGLTTWNALLQRLVFGSFDPLKRDWNRHPTDVYVIRKKPSGSELLSRKIGFLIQLLALSVLGFAVMYLALELRAPGSFVVNHAGYRPLWTLYFSAVSAATVGFGDVSPKTDWARLLTTLQVVTGPVFLSLLFLAFTDSSSDS
jgi:hypothetical protein